MIIFDEVHLSYGSNTILSGLSFEARFHEKIAILGKSGAGKTTILKLILGLFKPDSGRILIDGVDITTLKESQLRDFRMKFSIVFQEGALFDSLNVRENVAFCLREYSNLTESEIQKRVLELLRRVGVEEAVDLMPEQLSGGMQRRVAIARSLAACEPLMFLYDEPTTGLDPITADSICALMNELSGGQPPDRKGLIVVTHKVTDAVKVAERFLYLSNGRLAFDGDLEKLKNTENQELRRFIYDILHG
jgi:phospholipid/cholesterol/gamma-HCH transport system ATP-binding protein